MPEYTSVSLVGEHGRLAAGLMQDAALTQQPHPAPGVCVVKPGRPMSGSGTLPAAREQPLIYHSGTVPPCGGRSCPMLCACLLVMLCRVCRIYLCVATAHYKCIKPYGSEVCPLPANSRYCCSRVVQQSMAACTGATGLGS